jgi:hypothetical protein
MSRSFLQKGWGMSRIIVLVIISLQILGPIPAMASRRNCVREISRQALLPPARRAWARGLLASALLAVLPAPTRAGIISPVELNKPAPAVLEIGNALGNDRLLDCVMGTDKCDRFELRVVRYIDHFTDPVKDSLLEVTANRKSVSQSFDADVLGGERDVTLTLDSPGGKAQTKILPPDATTDIVHRQFESALANTRIVWDGPDGKPEVDSAGLGSLNFREHAADRFIIKVSSSDQPGTLELIVYDAADDKRYSRAVIRYEANQPRQYTVYFDPRAEKGTISLAAGPKGGADLTAVGAVSLQIEADALADQKDKNNQTRIDFVALAGLECISASDELTSYTAQFGQPAQYAGLFGNAPGMGNYGGLGGMGGPGGWGFGIGFGPGYPGYGPGGNPPIDIPNFPPLPPGVCDLPHTPPWVCPPPHGGGGGNPCIPSGVPEPGTLVMGFIAIVTIGAARVLPLAVKLLRR